MSAEKGIMLSIIKKFNMLFTKQQKRNLVILFFMMLLGAALEVLGVSLMLPLITTIMNPDIMETNVWVQRFCAAFNIHAYKNFAILCIVALIAVFIVKDLFLIFQYYVQAKFVYKSRFYTQCRLLRTYMNRPYEYFLNVESGEIIRVISVDVAHTFVLLTSMLTLATESIVSLVLVITVFVVEPAITLVLAVFISIVVVAIAKLVKPILRKAGLSLQKNSALTYKWLLQSINGIKEIKVTHTEEFFEENYTRSGTHVVQAEQWNTTLSNVPRLLIEMVTVCAMLVFIAIMILQGSDTESVIPSFGAFAVAAMKLLPGANRIVASFNSIAYEEPALDKTLENLAVAEAAANAVSKSVPEGGADLTIREEVVLKGITFAYPNSKTPVLHHADMIVPAGKSVGIVGTSGAGKTTAVDILLGLLKPQEGQILADGVDVMENYTLWLTKIGYIPQSIFMMDDTIRANVVFGLHSDEQDDAQVWKALEEAQLADFVRSLPRGLDTTIGERGVRLSGGQRQRIGIARALYSDPELLVFDEATSALDNETEAAIMESILSLHGKKTLIIIAHRLQTIEGCDAVYRVHEGAIERER